MTRILALDPGASFGWALTSAMLETTLELHEYWLPNYAVHIENTVCSCGAWQLGKVKDAGTRYGVLESLLRSINGLGAIIFEVSPGLRSKHSQRWHYGYRSHVEKVAAELSIPFEPVYPSAWKKSIIGNGRASKDEILYYAAGHFWLDASAPYDAADACHILAWWLRSVELQEVG